MIGGSVSNVTNYIAMPGTLNIYPKSLLLINMYYFVSTFIDSSGA